MVWAYSGPTVPGPSSIPKSGQRVLGLPRTAMPGTAPMLFTVPLHPRQAHVLPPKRIDEARWEAKTIFG